MSPMPLALGQRLPHNSEAERALLGGIILGGKGPWLDSSEFFLPFHQSLCQALTRLKNERKPTNDLVMLADLLSEHELQACGGIAYIAGLLDGLPRTANLGHYADIVRQYAQVRRGIALCDLIGSKLAAANGNAADVLREVSLLSAPLREGTSRNGAKLHAVSIADLLKLDIRPREMVLHPFLPTQGLAMLYSKRGVGKTFLSLGIAVAVASGTRFLRWSAPNSRRVLYVDGEMPCAALRQRVSDIIAGTDIGDPLDNLKIITPDLQERGLPDLATATGQEQIENHLEGVSLLVLDNLSSLVRGVKENEGEGWLPVQDWALDLRRRGISVLFVHHAGKAGAQRGTSRREDLLDSVITLKQPGDYVPTEGLRCEVHYEKTRGFYGEDAKPFEVKLLAGGSGEAIWTVADSEASAKSRARDLLAEGLSVRDVAEETGMSKSAVQRLKNDPVSQVSHFREARV